MLLHSIQSFINAAREFPVKLEAELNYSEDNLKSTIEQVASVVSEIYSKFPLMEEDEIDTLVKKGFLFYQAIKIMPPIQECERFKENLKKEIITSLNQEKDPNPSINLATVYIPQEQLLEVVRRSFTDLNSLSTFFPVKAQTIIFLKGNSKKLILWMNFKKPAF